MCAGTLLAAIAPPIRAYLRGRPDTARCVVQLVTKGDSEGQPSLLDEAQEVRALASAWGIHKKGLCTPQCCQPHSLCQHSAPYCQPLPACQCRTRARQRGWAHQATRGMRPCCVCWPALVTAKGCPGLGPRLSPPALTSCPCLHTCSAQGSSLWLSTGGSLGDGAITRAWPLLFCHFPSHLPVGAMPGAGITKGSSVTA